MRLGTQNSRKSFSAVESPNSLHSRSPNSPVRDPDALELLSSGRVRGIADTPNGPKGKHKSHLDSPTQPRVSSSPTPRVSSFGFNQNTPSSKQRSSAENVVHRTGTTAPPNLTTAYLHGTHTNEQKELNSVDWHAEGPGRRVGYDNLTAIDWIFEYSKERQRLRVLRSSTSGILGNLQQVVDSSQIWILLVCTGIATGVLAASMDIVSDWLADLKTGICTAGEGGGRFYLNTQFCCWGLDDTTQCRDWISWSDMFRVSSRGGSWIVRYIFFILFSVVFASSASLLVQKFSHYAKQSGIPEIKTVLSGFVIRRFLGAWTLIVKSLGLCLAVASGLWLGKEGPLVHVACCCANLLLKTAPVLNSNEARKREILSAAAAAGISVAFGSPVGGVLFSLEQLSYYFPDKTMWQSFVCAMVAAVTLQLFNPFRTGKLVLYQVTYSTSWHAFELVPFAFLGIVGGLYGALLIKLNMRIARWRKASSFLSKHPITEVVIATTITAMINFPNKFMRAQASELVSALFAECSQRTDESLGLCGMEPPPVVLSRLLSAALLGFILTSLTFGLQIPAGILLPSMAIGALFGRAVGLCFATWQARNPISIVFAQCSPDVPCISAGTYAIIGAASFLGGATRMTVSIVVIMFELTGALTYVLPIMISVLLSKWVGDAFGRRGIYESWIHLNAYPILDNRDDAPLPDVGVAQLMTRVDDLVAITAAGHTLASLERLLAAHPHRGFPVIAEPRDALLLGYISRAELVFALAAAARAPRSLPPTAEAFFAHQPLADPSTSLDLRPWMDQTPLTLSANSSLELTANLFLKLGLRYVLFCDRGMLKGLLTKKDIWYVLDGPDETRRGHGVGGGVLREDTDGEQRGLLGEGEGQPDSHGRLE